MTIEYHTIALGQGDGIHVGGHDLDDRTVNGVKPLISPLLEAVRARFGNGRRVEHGQLILAVVRSLVLRALGGAYVVDMTDGVTTVDGVQGIMEGGVTIPVLNAVMLVGQFVVADKDGCINLHKALTCEVDGIDRVTAVNGQTTIVVHTRSVEYEVRTRTERIRVIGPFEDGILAEGITLFEMIGLILIDDMTYNTIATGDTREEGLLVRTGLIDLLTINI